MKKPTLTTKATPYGIGSDTFPGLSKYIEKSGNANQVIGKIQGCGHLGDHRDSKVFLKERLEDELADVVAAIAYISEKNNLNLDHMEVRSREKLIQFIRRHDNVQAGRDPNDNGEN